MSIRHSTSRNYSRDNFGEAQNLCTLLAFVLFLAAVIVGVLNNSILSTQFRDFANSQIVYPAQYTSEIARLENQPIAFDYPIGTIDYKIKLGDTPEMSARLSLNDDQTIYRSVSLGNGMELYGTAKYTLVGSVLKYSNITGDEYLFSDVGSPLYNSDGMTFMELDGSVRIALVTDALATAYEIPIVIEDNRSTLDIILSQSTLKQLQLCLLALGILVLLYILARINLFPGSKRKAEPTGTKFAA